MFEEKIEKYPDGLRALFSRLNDLIFAAVPYVQARTWGGIPSYYLNDSFVRLVPFADHINIEAAALPSFKPRLSGYSFTAKGMLQIYVEQTLPSDVLTEVFVRTLTA